MGKHGRDDLGVVFEALRKERPDRTVNKTRGERFLLGRSPFALEIATGNLAGRKRLFLVVDGQGKEIDPRPWFFRGDDRRKNASFAISREDCAVCLTRNTPRFKL